MEINNHVVKAIVDMAVFLEFTNADLLNEDAAVEAMEQLAAELQQMPEGERLVLAKKIVALSSAYGATQREFVEGLPDSLGLA